MISFELPTSAGEAMVVVLALLLGLVAADHAGADPVGQPDHRHHARAWRWPSSRPRRERWPARHARATRRSCRANFVWHVVLVALLFLAAVFGIFTYAIDKGYPLALAQTMAMNTLVVLEIFHLFFIRNIHGTSLTWAAARGTRVVWIVVIAITAAQFAVTYLPPLQTVLGTRPVPLTDGLLIVAIGVAFFAIIEIEKQIRLGLRG